MQWNQQGFTALFGRDRGRLCGSGSDFALSFGSLRRASRLASFGQIRNGYV